jgi:hypothetical protein
MVFRFHWMYFKKWYNSFIPKCQYLWDAKNHILGNYLVRREASDVNLRRSSFQKLWVPTERERRTTGLCHRAACQERPQGNRQGAKAFSSPEECSKRNREWPLRRMSPKAGGPRLFSELFMTHGDPEVSMCHNTKTWSPKWSPHAGQVIRSQQYHATLKWVHLPSLTSNLWSRPQKHHWQRAACAPSPILWVGDPRVLCTLRTDLGEKGM